MATKGRCNCGNITVELVNAPQGSVICYCSNCQRSSAGACSVNYFISSPSEVKISDPNNSLKKYKDSDTKTGNAIVRHFCGNCGCPVMSLADEENPKGVVKAGLFDQIKVEPVMEFFVEERASWMKVVKAGEGQTKLS